MRTYTPKPADIQREWHVIDATDVRLGRLAVQIATLLRGKHKPTYAPHVDGGDFVIVINASKVALTGNKRENKLAYRHSGYPGGLRAVAYSDLLEKHPERAIEKAVRGMLPKSSLARQQLTKLKVYAGAEHPHAASSRSPSRSPRSLSRREPAEYREQGREDTSGRDHGRHRPRGR